MSFITTTRFLRFPPLGDSGLESRISESAPASAEPSDESLFVLLCQGDKGALTLLFRRYARLVRSVAVQILRNSGEAEDLVQDVFLYIFKKCDSFQSSKSTARSWIVQITYHRAIDRRRYLATRRFYDQVDIDGPGIDIPSERPDALYDQSIEAVLGSDAKKIFDSLTADQRETLRLFFFEGYTFKEIATLLRQTIGNVRNHYYRGLEKIRVRVFSKKIAR